MLEFLPTARLTFGFETVTPEMAAEWLQHDGRQRPVNEVRVGELARDMTAGAWRINGEALVFSIEGILLDGRKRLMACIMSDMAFTTLVVRGVAGEACLSLDSRKTRALGDVLTASGWGHGRLLNTTLKLIAHMAEGTWNVRCRKRPNVLHAVLKAHPEIADMLTASMCPGRKGSPAIHAAMRFIFSRIDAAEADAFFDAVYDPDRHELSARDPRRRLARILADILARKVRMTSHRDNAALFIHAWNAHHSGQKSLRVPEPGEEFPAIEFWDQSCAIRLEAAVATGGFGQGINDSADELSVAIEHVDPGLASLWLEENTSNRKISENTVDRYCRDMEAGQWQLTGETVKFGRSGRLLDGQHRLTAIIQSGETLPMLVVEGLDESVFDTLDIGERHAYPAILAERGMRQPGTLAAALKLVMCIERDVDLRGFLPTNAELDTALQRHPGLVDALDDSGAKPLEPSHAVAASYLFARSDQEMAAEFLRKVRGLGTFDETDPVWHLRQRLENGRRGKNLNGDTPSTALQFAITAWNAFRRGRKVSRLTLKPVPGRTFPEIL